MDNPINKQEIRILSENLNKLKELYMMPYINHDEEHSWYSFFIPIFDGDKVINNKVYTQRTKNQILRFIIEINFAIVSDSKSRVFKFYFEKSQALVVENLPEENFEETDKYEFVLDYSNFQQLTSIDVHPKG